MLGLATIGLAVRAAVVFVIGAAPIIALVAIGELTAYAVMGGLSAVLPLPTAEYVVAAPHRLPAEDERVDVIFTAVLTVPTLVLLVTLGWTLYGLAGAVACSVTPLGLHALVQVLIGRRHLLDEWHAALERATASLAQKQRQLGDFTYIVTHDMKTPLALVKRIVEAHGGDVTIESIPGRGSVLRVCLPARGESPSRFVEHDVRAGKGPALH